MKFFLLVVCVIGVLCFFLGTQPQQRGLHDDILVSTARPALAVVPGNGLSLLDSGWCDVQPPARVSGTVGQAKVWYTLYEGQNPDRRLLVLLAETGSLWEWPYTFQKNHHTWARLGSLPLRRGTTLHYGEYVLTPERDPWKYLAEGDWAAGSIVRQSLLLRQFNTVKLIVEYREPLREVQGRLPILEDIPALVGVQERSENAFQLWLPEEKGQIPSVTRALDKAPAELSRRVLARWLGEVQRQGGRE